MARTGLQITSQVIATTRNRAVLSLISAGLRSTSAEARAAVIQAAVRRLDPSTHLLLLAEYPNLHPGDHLVYGDAHRKMPHHAGPVLRRVIVDGDPARCASACAVIRLANDYTQFPTLLKAAESKRHSFLPDVLKTVTALVETLHQELANWAAGDRTSAHDPTFVRHSVLVALEQSLARFAQHGRVELLDAFISLASIDNTVFLKVLRDPRHAAHAMLVEELRTSKDSGIMERLVELLRDTEAPKAILDVIAGRGDAQFLSVLMHALKHPAPVRVLHNMKRLRRVAWLEGKRDLLLELDGRAQAIAVDLALASDIPADSLFELLRFILKNGMAEGRRASCQGLTRFTESRASELIVAALGDPDAGVQAAALRQLRSRKIPEALKLLVDRLDSRSVEVRDAARTSLAEFNFVRYRAMFDHLDMETARTTGRLVHKVDYLACQQLVEELTSPSISTRLRAIEMALAMAAADDVQPQLIDLAHNENASLRKEAVLALGHCHREGSLQVLETATHDANGSVAEAARISIAQLRQAGALDHASPTGGAAK